ncbi:ATP-binding protein [Streptomyces sp. NPDC127033]|uniref:ATP-binding protein n=1 Tax=Streptomyces sp. NPDC127033 TaxID=3347110 RepID=UPI00366A142B
MPEETSSFVGRRTELILVERALDEHRLTTLTGSGGVGKSRLALRAAERARAAGDYPDGVWWADLAPLHDERMLLSTVSDAVGLSDHSLRMPIDALCEWLVHRRLLLVLDSCERMTEACGHLVGELLTAVPGLTVLTTSRQPLGIPAEHLLDVPPLPLDGVEGIDGEDGLDDVLQLFRDRAARAAPRLSFDDPDTLASAAQICHRLEGIPLAVELACARLDENSVDQIALLLDSRLDTLTHQNVWPQRHRALRTAIGWSHELCAPLERLLWARLSVFRGDIDANDARAVCAGGPLTPDGVTQALAGLARQSVLRRDTLGADGHDRYRMLDTIREYGTMWLAELGEEKLLADRHAAHFADLARRAHTGWAGGGQVAWYRRITDTHADLCAALNHLLAEDPAAALDMAGRVAFFWTCGGHLHEARIYLEYALDADRTPGPDRSRALWALGVTVMLQGDHEGAFRLGERCSVAAWHDREPESLLSAAYLLSLTCLMMGRAQASYVVADRALRTHPADFFDSPAQLRCRLARIFALTGLGRFDEARDQAMELRRVCVDRGECWTRSYADYQLALIFLLQGRPYEAEAYARSMVAGKEELGDSFGIALGLDLLAAAVAAQGDGERAAHAYGTGQAFWRMIGHPQRGTPELEQVREECERQARVAAGNPAYENAFHRGLVDDGRSGLARALRGHLPGD